MRSLFTIASLAAMLPGAIDRADIGSMPKTAPRRHDGSRRTGPTKAAKKRRAKLAAKSRRINRERSR